MITRLKLFASSISINICNDYTVADNTYYKARFVEVVEVYILDRVLRTYVGHQLEPYVYKLKVFVEGSLEVVDI